tara:strand:+ start:391 stop:855 length:465 start_codon:yes stop_codon:yes gene_type:complete
MNNEKVVWWVQRTNDQVGPLLGQVPKFIQSTGGMPPLAFVDERYGVTWNSQEERPFELPTGGAGVMHEGENVMYFARKEQCLALTRHLKKLKPGVKEYKVYRVIEGEEPTLVHSSDNKPEKLQKDRKQVNTNMRKINENVSQHSLKFTKRNTFD